MSERRLLVLEPYYGGSHRTVLDGLLARSGWDADVLTLPARKWKWRMRGSGVTMAGEACRLDAEWRAGVLERPKGSSSRWDLVFASTFVNLAEFLGLAREATSGVSTIVYFHENQLVYPVRHEAEWDFQFPLTNITSALAADACFFNTHFTMESFLAGIPGFLRRFPDHRPTGAAERIAAKSRVLHPPFDPAPFDAAPAHRGERPRVVWPHRWEHDKDPESFFGAVSVLAREGLDFEVAVAGQAFEQRPEVFGEAAEALGRRLVHLGEPGSREDYARLLASSDVAVSTAQNEFFGLAMVEAAYAGCFPLVPDRLAYPELYPPQMRYRDGGELVARLRSLVLERPAPGAARSLATEYTFDSLMPAWLRAFDEAVGRECSRVPLRKGK